MAHVTVVTRNPAIAMGLTHHGYDVTDVRPDRHGDWARQALGSQAVVLELSDPIAADAAVRRLRADGNGVQVLVVVTDTDGWDAVLAHAGPGVRALPLPLSLPALLAAVEELVAAGPVDVPPPPRTEEELLSAVARQVGLSITDSGALLSTTPPRPPEAPVPVAPPTAAVGAAALVAALTPVARDLTGVPEAAEVAVADLTARTAAEAAALLLPDGDHWRVAAGHNLRPFEHSATLTADHWLVEHVALGAHGTVVDREHLGGAPLASWDEVLAVPVEGVDGVLVAARSGLAFDEAALDAAREVAEEAAPLLREAVAVRVLARALAPYADVDD